MSVISVFTPGFPLPGIISPQLAYFYRSGLSSNTTYQWSIPWSVNKVVPSKIPSNMPFFVIAFIALAIYRIHFIWLKNSTHTLKSYFILFIQNSRIMSGAFSTEWKIYDIWQQPICAFYSHFCSTSIMLSYVPNVPYRSEHPSSSHAVFSRSETSFSS